METENRQRPEEETEQTNVPAQQPDVPPTRSNILWILAGAYLFYTGIQLCQNFLKGSEESTPLFMAIGIAFLVIGAVLFILGGKRMIRADKIKKAMEDAAAAVEREQIRQTQAAEEDTEETVSGKKRSIADRANLVQELEENDEDK